MASLSEFDQYARNYLHELDHPLRRLVASDGGRYFIALKASHLREILGAQELPSVGRTAVDIGSGIGLFEAELKGYFQHLFALDLSFEMLRVSRQIRPPQTGEGALCANALALPLPDAGVDVVFGSCVFHHMPHEWIDRGVAEMARVCRPGGTVVIYEHNPFNPLTQLVVRTTPLDRSARLMRARRLVEAFRRAGLVPEAPQFILYGPQAIDRRLRHVKLLRRLPFGGQYAVIGRKPG